MKMPANWDEFHAWLMAVYWPAMPPEHRMTSRPLPEGEDAEGDVVVPDDVWQAAVLMFPSPEAWLANPIPNLDRRTPLQAIGAGEADGLRQILMEIAAFRLPPPDSVAPWEESGGAGGGT